jgi:hypothetical protein
LALPHKVAVVVEEAALPFVLTLMLAALMLAAQTMVSLKLKEFEREQLMRAFFLHSPFEEALNAML